MPPDFEPNIPRNLSDDGSRVFFDAADDLVEADNNGRRDVYEYMNGGLRGSTGTSRYDAFFQDASSTGDDVFFSTRARLTFEDGDDLIDIYDARVGGGFAPPPHSDPGTSGTWTVGPPSVAYTCTFSGVPVTCTYGGSGSIVGTFTSGSPATIQFTNQSLTGTSPLCPTSLIFSASYNVTSPSALSVTNS